MCTLIRKWFPLIILSVLFLFAPSPQHASETHEYGVLSSDSAAYLNPVPIANADVRLARTESIGESFAANTAGPQSRILARWDLYELLFGTFLTLLGLAAIVLSFFRWNPSDLSFVFYMAPVPWPFKFFLVVPRYSGIIGDGISPTSFPSRVIFLQNSSWAKVGNLLFGVCGSLQLLSR